MSNWRRMLKEAKALWEEGLIDDIEYEQLKKEAFRIQTSGEVEEFSTSLALLQLKMKLQDRIKQVNRLGWRITMPDPPYHEQRLEDLIYRVEQQINYVDSCKNIWGVPHPHFPITPESFQKHKAKIAQQKKWDGKIQNMYAKTKLPRPEPPYTKSVVNRYLNFGRQKRKKKLGVWLEVSIVVLIFLSYYIWEWRKAQVLQDRAYELGLTIKMPVFRRKAQVQELVRAEKVFHKAAELERRARPLGWNLKFQRPYDTAKVHFIDQHFEQLERTIESGVNLNELKVYSIDQYLCQNN